MSGDVTSSWNEASLYALWTGVSSGTGQSICLIASLYNWLMVALVSDGLGGSTHLFDGITPLIDGFTLLYTSYYVAWLWLDIVYLFVHYYTYLRGLNLA
jgi:hypothetical protein